MAIVIDKLKFRHVIFISDFIFDLYMQIFSVICICKFY